MFNNAGIPSDNEVRVTQATEDFKRVFDVNVLGGFLGAKYAARVMVLFKKEEGRGDVCGLAVLKGTVLEPEDFAHAALNLASDEAKFISGVNLPVDAAYGVSNQSWKMGFAALSE
ncbi:hypothetical protein J1N35_006282 [Gossypium stocksii]|uniref:Uncharacterized protein n=1 Tax=Gossypium stocksii TaxID=47602 RepID=A0A9D4AHX6_9ROSI|nr:hypothetical protein J1N35_006282 [Gossypium stocksii]